MMPARTTGQFAAKSSLVFWQPQNYSSDEYSLSYKDTAFYYLPLNSSKKAPKIPAAAAAAQCGSVKRVPHQHLSCPAGCPPCPATLRRLRAVRRAWISRGRATGQLRCTSRPARAAGRMREMAAKARQRMADSSSRCRLLPTEQLTGLKPRGSRRPPLPLSPPALRSARGRGGARAAAAGGGT